MTEKIKVCHREELELDTRKVISAESGKEIGVFNVGGKYYAVENACPHRGGPVCNGQIQKEIRAEWRGPGNRIEETISSIPTIACPWHGWEFKLETGEHIGDSQIYVKTYEVVVEDDNVYVIC